jgi:hypothetical protein
MKYQCQIPPCTAYAGWPKRSPRICERHQGLDTRHGMICIPLLWAALWHLARMLEEKAQQLFAQGEINDPTDMQNVRAVIRVGDLTDLVVANRFDFLAMFDPEGRWPEGERNYFLNIYPTLARKPRVHMLGVLLRMVDAFGGLKAARVLPERVLTVYANVGPRWVATQIRNLHALEVGSAKILVITQPWKVELPRLEERTRCR